METIERKSSRDSELWKWGFGSDTGGGDTVGLLKWVTELSLLRRGSRFGHPYKIAIIEKAREQRWKGEKGLPIVPCALSFSFSPSSPQHREASAAERGIGIVKLNEEWSSKLRTQIMQLLKKPEKKKRKENQDFNGIWTLDLAIPVRCSDQLSYDWSHWCWELVNYVFICSSERDECDKCIWNKSCMRTAEMKSNEEWSSQLWTQFGWNSLVECKNVCIYSTFPIETISNLK